MIQIKARTTGGHKLNKFLREAGKGGVDEIQVGFFSSARYADGTPVASVALWNEFGTRKKDGRQHIPPRPFFRRALRKSQRGISAILGDDIDPKKMAVDRQTANKVGAYVQGMIQNEIVTLRTPANARVTIEGGWIKSYHGKWIRIKGKGGTNPLIADGTMRLAVTWQVD